MTSITVDKEILWRGSFDEYATVQLQRVTRLTDGDDVSDRYWRRVITPDDDADDLANLLGVGAGVASALKVIVEAVRIPAAVQRYEDRKAETAP